MNLGVGQNLVHTADMHAYFCATRREKKRQSNRERKREKKYAHEQADPQRPVREAISCQDLGRRFMEMEKKK